jgi:chromosome segregation ATPase
MPATDDEIPYKKLLVESKKEEIAQLETQKSNLHDLLEQKVYDVNTFIDRQQKLVERINVIQEEVRNLMSEIQKEELRHTSVTDILPQLQTVIAEYWNANIETRNQMLKTVLEKATYLRKKEWTKPDQFMIQLYPQKI